MAHLWNRPTAAAGSRNGRAPVVAVALLATVFAAGMRAQIPERAPWEITFAQVEAAAGLPDLRTAAPNTFEARLVERPWSAMAPVPFLRLARVDGAVTAQLFVFWTPNRLPAGRRIEGPDVTCRDGVCVRPLDLEEQRNWTEVITTLAAQDACATKSGNPRVVSACADCDHLWIKTDVDGHYREQSCNAPGAQTLAASLLQLMQRAARTAGF
jgi:hypothetical protein